MAAAKKLTPEQIQEIIRQRKERGIAMSTLAVRFGVSQPTIYYHLKRAGLAGNKPKF